VIILVDGYNLLKTIKGGTISEKERMAFVNFLGKYNKSKGHKIYVIFDGGVGKYPEHSRHHGIDIIYSGTVYTADELIIQKNEEYAQKDLLVVTADNGIINRLEGRSAAVIEPILFYQKIIESSQSVARTKDCGIVIKWSDQENGELDRLMEETVGHALKNEDEFPIDQGMRTSAANVASKAERAYHRKLKKL